MATGDSAGVFYDGEHKSLYATRDFRQGEVILPRATMETINYSYDPNAAIRNGRLVAWSCIMAGAEITIMGKD